MVNVPCAHISPMIVEVLPKLVIVYPLQFGPADHAAPGRQCAHIL